MSAIDWNWVTRAIDDLTLNYGDPFLQIGLLIHFWLGVIVLILYSMKWLLEGSFSIKGFMMFVGLFIASGWMLAYYNTPLPFSSYSFKQFIPGIAADLSNIIANSRMDQVIQRTLAIANNLQKPTITLASLDLWGLVQYWLIEIYMWFLSAFMLVPIAVSFIAVALGAIMWPIVIPFMMVPKLSWLFWSALTYIIKYSFFRVWAIMLTYVIAGVYTQFLDQIILPDLPAQHYSLAQFTGMTPIVMILFLIVFIWMVFALPKLLTDFFSGTASGGSNFLSSVTNIAKFLYV